LLIITAKVTLTGNISSLNENDKSVGIMGILGINAISPFADPIRIMAFIILFRKDFICSFVLLQYMLGDWRLRNNVNGARHFNIS